MKAKNETFAKFQEFKPLIENKRDRTFVHGGLIIVVNLIHIILMISVEIQGSRGS